MSDDKALRQEVVNLCEMIGAEASDAVPIVLRFAKQQQAVGMRQVESQISVGMRNENLTERDRTVLEAVRSGCADTATALEEEGKDE